MGKKQRSDSLYARCTPEQREELLVFLVELGGPYDEALRMLEKWGVSASLGSLSRFLEANGMDWRLKRAAQKAGEAEGRLPGDFQKHIRTAMAQKEFELSFRDLSLKEYVALKGLQLDERSAETKARLEEKKIKLAERRVKVAERKLDSLKGALTEGSLSNDQRVARMKQIFGIGA